MVECNPPQNQAFFLLFLFVYVFVGYLDVAGGNGKGFGEENKY